MCFPCCCKEQVSKGTPVLYRSVHILVVVTEKPEGLLPVLQGEIVVMPDAQKFFYKALCSLQKFNIYTSKESFR